MLAAAWLRCLCTMAFVRYISPLPGPGESFAEKQVRHACILLNRVHTPLYTASERSARISASWSDCHQLHSPSQTTLLRM